MNFEEKFNQFIPELTEALTVPNSRDWGVKGFIDYHQNIYSISTDTKVVSKIIELMIFPKFLEFARSNDLKLELAPHQNYYPDITFIDYINETKGMAKEHERDNPSFNKYRNVFGVESITVIDVK